MTISSVGVGSGLDVQSIVSQLVAIEKQPLTQLQSKASTYQAQLSLYGQVKSQASALGDAAALLASSSGWNTQKASSSNTDAVGVTAGTSASAAVMSVDVQQLARAQSTASAGVAAGVAAGASGSLSIQLGSWSGSAFSAGADPALSVAVDAVDTISTIAGKINAAGAGVSATVLRDGTNERLVIRSSTTGEAAGFQLNTPQDAGLAVLGLTNPGDGAAFVGQTALNAKVKINGVDISSATNKMSEVLPGVTLQLNQVTSAPAEVTVETDLDTIQKNIQSLVDTYNTLNSTLANATKYTAATKTAGLLQGDSTAVGLQNVLRTIFGSTSSGSSFSRLSEIGIERQADGSLKINQTKLTSAQDDLGNLKKLFATDNSDTATNGFAIKVRDFSRGLVTFDGSLTNKTTALQGSITRNAADQTLVTDRASRVETQLLKQYSALDAQMATLTNLSSYVTQQITMWNNTTTSY